MKCEETTDGVPPGCALQLVCFEHSKHQPDNTWVARQLLFL